MGPCSCGGQVFGGWGLPCALVCTNSCLALERLCHLLLWGVQPSPCYSLDPGAPRRLPAAIGGWGRVPLGCGRGVQEQAEHLQVSQHRQRRPLSGERVAGAVRCRGTRDELKPDSDGIQPPAWSVLPGLGAPAPASSAPLRRGHLSPLTYCCHSPQLALLQVAPGPAGPRARGATLGLVCSSLNCCPAGWLRSDSGSFTRALSPEPKQQIEMLPLPASLASSPTPPALCMTRCAQEPSAVCGNFVNNPVADAAAGTESSSLPQCQVGLAGHREGRSGLSPQSQQLGLSNERCSLEQSWMSRGQERGASGLRSPQSPAQLSWMAEQRRAGMQCWGCVNACSQFMPGLRAHARCPLSPRVHLCTENGWEPCLQ